MCKIRLQTQGGQFRGRGSLQVIGKLLQQGIGRGSMGIYRGFYACMLRDSIGCAMYFPVYQFTSNYLRETINCETSHFKRMATCAVSGGLAGVMMWATTLPIDVIKSRIQADQIATPRYNGEASV